MAIHACHEPVILVLSWEILLTLASKFFGKKMSLLKRGPRRSVYSLQLEP